MVAHVVSLSRSEPLLLSLSVANAATVSTLYWAQAVVVPASEEFGASAAVALMPGATLGGYAAGVALLAFAGGDLTAAHGLRRHVLVLMFGLCGVAAAPTAAWAAAACALVGLGCALTQRLLACAGGPLPVERRAATIGVLIASGLAGIVVARALVPTASHALGWRTMFWLDAGLCGTCGLWASWVARRTETLISPLNAASLPSALALWRREPVLRRAACQQAVVFAVFNMGWAVFARLLLSFHVAPALPMGAIATLGASAALLSGRACSRLDPAHVARAGLGAVLSGAGLLCLFRTTLDATLLSMIAIDAGTQMALVANQARAQALATGAALRGRIAALVTTVGFAGGALGAAIGNWVS